MNVGDDLSVCKWLLLVSELACRVRSGTVDCGPAQTVLVDGRSPKAPVRPDKYQCDRRRKKDDRCNARIATISQMKLSGESILGYSVFWLGTEDNTRGSQNRPFLFILFIQHPFYLISVILYKITGESANSCHCRVLSRFVNMVFFFFFIHLLGKCLGLSDYRHILLVN